MSFLYNLKNFWKKFWFVVWRDPSFKGWLISIIFIFIVIKFIFFPLLSLATGTSLPLAIVESCSMYHDGNMFSNFDNWWTQNSNNYADTEISKEEFSEYLFYNGFTKGDILFILGVKPSEVKIGDIIIFKTMEKDIIHRVINIKSGNGKYTFTTMGDNVGRVQFFEETINEDQLVGKASGRIAPYVGWVKLIFYESSRSPDQRGFC